MWKQSYKYVGQKSPGAPTQVIVDNKMITDPAEVANACQDALLGKVDRITSNIPASNIDCLSYTRDYVASLNLCTFEYPSCNLMRGVGYKEVKTAIKSLKNTTASGVDNLCTKFLKMLRTPLLHILTCICNRSFEQRKYPDLYKLSRVTLLCKDKNEKFNPLKYRPVSILPAPSKILEKVVVTRVTDHMEKTGFFPDEAHGYRARRSTTTAVISMQDEILSDLERGVDSIVIFCDLSNAFDTLSHETIVNKLRVYGFSEASLEWYASYLKNRAQFVGLGGSKSRQRRVVKGVPQGSLSGSILFSIIFGDVVIVQIADNVFMILYADDLSIKMRLCGNVVLDEMMINRQMNAIQLWMDSNLLVFNDLKTEVLVVSRGKRDVYKDLKLTMRNGTVKHQKSARMLGLQLTYNLRHDWFICQMPGNLIASLNQRMNVLSKLKKKCGPEQFKLLCYGLLFSKVSYGVQYWQQCTEVLKDKIRLVLNRCVRMATNTSLLQHRRTQTMYDELKFLTFDNVCKSQDLHLLWSIMWMGTPKSLAKKVNITGNELGGPMTRSRSSVYRPTLTRENQGVYTAKREAFISRSLRIYHDLVRNEGDLYQQIVNKAGDEKKRKKILKDFLLKKQSIRR